MHRPAALFLLLAFAVPAISLAQTPPQPDTKPPACFLTSEKDPSGIEEFATADVATKLKPYLIEAIMCPTACYDEVLTMEFTTKGVTVRVKAANKCGSGVIPRKATAESLNYGCAAGQTKPRFTLQLIGAAAKPPKSDFRCSTAAVNSAVTGATTQDMKSFALRTIALTAVTGTDLSIPENQQKFRTILQAFGVSEADAKNVVENKPEDARSLLSAFASGDKARIDRAAGAAGVTLNEGTVNDFVNLQPEQQVKSFDALYSDLDRTNINAHTFAQEAPVQNPMDRAKVAISCIESSCGNYNAIGPVTRTGHRAIGKYQVMEFNVPSWTSRSCGRAMSAYEFQADHACQEKVFETVFGGYVQSCGSYEAAASKWFSGRCQITNSNDGSLSVPQYIQKFSSYFSGAKTSLPFGSAGRAYTGAIAPFSRNNPFGGSSDGDGIVCTGTGYCYLAGYAQPAALGQPVQVAQPAPVAQPSQQTQPQSPVQSTNPSQIVPSTTATPTIPPAVASLVVQPKEVVRGREVKVSWSSVGMSTEMLCQVFAGTSFLAQGNEGSRAFDTTSVSASTTLKFSLQCFSKTGAKVQKEESVTIK